jgi:serine/threonine protein kinase
MILYKGDCLIESEKIETGSVDLILTDLPYGTVEGIGNNENIQHGMKGKTEWDSIIDTEKIMIIATIVRLIDKTCERVGNEQSKLNGHFGITNLRKKHIKINGSKITLDYTGKSGMKHNVTISDIKAANILLDNNGRVYLSDFGASKKLTSQLKKSKINDFFMMKFLLIKTENK